MSMTNVNDVFRTQKVACTGLKSNRQWLNIISNNIANANTVDTGSYTKDGYYIPYARQVPVFSKILSEKFRENKVNGDVLNGVAVEKIVNVNDNVKKIYDPAHPAARKTGPDAGYVYYPGVIMSQEMADLRVAAASYEANLTVISTSKRMMKQTLAIGK